MSEAPPAAPFREQTLARFDEHRRAWERNEAVRTLYGRWYGRVRESLPSPSLGPWVEIGSGPGLARNFIPELELTDVVRAPWHSQELDAESLPFADGSIGALVLFDVLHHLPAGARFWAEASRVLRPGGRVVLCEPYISLLSYAVYRWFHEEGADMGVDPLSEMRGEAPGDPFEGNQAIPTLLFQRRKDEFHRRFPVLRLRRVEHLAGLSYPASGGFSRTPFLPMPLWRLLLKVEDWLPRALFRWIGFRLLAVVEKTG
jgi:SAM-dependent methyltransferase